MIPQLNYVVEQAGNQIIHALRRCVQLQTDLSFGILSVIMQLVAKYRVSVHEDGYAIRLN
jgi:hypothetical protein